ncbi:MAG: response regulator [Myxococcota bacterium]
MDEIEGSRILVVDDDPIVLETLGLMLAAFGYAVEAVESGEAALAAAARDPVDLLLTDIRMPEMDGHELAAAFERAWPDTPVLFLSGYADDRPTLGPRRRYMSKPFDMHELLRTVGELLRG